MFLFNKGSLRAVCLELSLSKRRQKEGEEKEKSGTFLAWKTIEYGSDKGHYNKEVRILICIKINVHITCNFFFLKV